MTIIKPCTPTQHVRYKTPWGMEVTVHQALRSRFKAACEEAHRTCSWKPRSIDSYNCRQIRGSTAWSRHAYAAAWDFFDITWEQRVKDGVDVWGPSNAPSEKFCVVFRKYGFNCGRDWSGRKDYPHIEWASNAVPEFIPPPPPKKKWRVTAVKTVKPDRKWKLRRKTKITEVIEGRQRARERAAEFRDQGFDTTIKEIE